jgi:predicted nucleic acid-binding Zn ribbon protein
MDEKKRSSGEQPLGDLIDKLLKAYQLDGKMKEFDVISKWEEMMGRAVFLRTNQIYIKNKILFLQIDSSIMREELKYGKSVIIQRVNEYAGKEIITDVWFS